MKNILVTGGAGFIGSKLSIKLIEKNYNVIVLDNLNSQIHGDNPEKSFTYNLIKNKVKFIHGDVNNINDWRKALADVEIVIHFAAETGTGQSMYEISKYIESNIGGTANLYQILANEQNKVKKIVLASSRAVYGEGKYMCQLHGEVFPTSRLENEMSKGDFEVKCPICNSVVKMLPTDEESLLHPNSVYGYTKLAQEQISLMMGKTLKIPTLVFRFQNVYGPGQSLKNPYTGILSIFSTLIKNEKDINIYEDGYESRDFVYVDDVVDSVILGIENQEIMYDIFNVGSGEKIDVIKIAQSLKTMYNSKVNLNVTGNYRLGDIRHNLADLRLIKRTLGYKPNFDFLQGVSLFIKWVNEQEIEQDLYDKSVNEMKKKGLYK